MEDAEDYVEYHIYELTPEGQPESPEALFGRLQSRRTQFLEFVQRSFVLDYIWQKDPFSLHISQPNKEGALHLVGKTRFGENAEDEWFVVFLLLELSKQFADIAISVVDNDGEFLLIEAALVLPRWLKPENSANRIWIKGGHLHIIPFPRTPAQLREIPSQLTLSNALSLLASNKVKTLADPAVEEAVEARLKEYPTKTKESHWVKCRVPIDIARLLEASPQLIAPAANAFYHRNIEGMFVCSQMAKFPPKKKGEGEQWQAKGSVLTSVRFTRCLYAQLACQKFFPPKPFTLPPQNDPQYKAEELGMKLACGFEMLYHSAKRKASVQMTRADPLNPESYPFNSDQEWKSFKEALTKIGYFGDEMVGSKEYKRKEDFAKKDYLEGLQRRQTSSKSKEDGATSGGKNEALLIDEILQRAAVEEPGLEGDEALCLRCTRALRPDDRDDWMKISPEDLDSMLATRQKEFEEYDNHSASPKRKRQKKKGEEEGDKGAGGGKEAKLREFEGLVQNMRSFVDTVSAYEGAEFPKQAPSDQLGFDIDPDLFVQILKNSLVPDEDEDEDSDKRFYSMSDDSEEEEDDDLRGEGPADTAIQALMEQMDRELYTTKVGQDFEKVPDLDKWAKDSQHTPDDDASGVESFRPVDVDLNLMKNILESLDAQHGLPGPYSNILNEMKPRSK